MKAMERFFPTAISRQNKTRPCSIGSGAQTTKAQVRRLFDPVEPPSSPPNAMAGVAGSHDQDPNDEEANRTLPTTWTGHPSHPRRRKSNSKESSSKRLRSADGSCFGACPLCGSSFPLHRLFSHASECEGTTGTTEAVAPRSTAATEATTTTDRFRPDRPTVSGSIRAAQPLVDLPALGRNPEPFEDDDTVSRGSSPLAGGWQPLPPTTTESSSTLSQPPTPTPPPPQQLLPPGLFLYEEFVTEEEEARILAQIDGEGTGHPAADAFAPPWKASTFNGSHRGKQWGVRCQLKERRVDPADRDLPAFLKALVLPRIEALVGPMAGTVPNEANAIDYCRDRGDWLKSHVDDRRLSKEPIANLSLAGDCVMTFERVVPLRKYEMQHGAVTASATTSPSTTVPKRQSYRVLLRRRTLQVLTGPARYEYSHGIRPEDLLSVRRVSVTMRESPLTESAAVTSTTTNAAALLTSPTAHRPTAGAATQPRPPTVPWWKAPPPAANQAAAASASAALEPARGAASAPSSFFLVPTMVPIPGLLLFEEFVTEDEERQILAELDGGAHDRDGGITAHAPSSSTASAATPSWKPERHSGVHREQRYGMDHDLWSRSVRAPVRPMPSFVNRLLVPRFYSQIRMLRNLRFSPNEGNAIEYRRGRSWLESHVDDRAKHREVITNLSLAGDCCMTFTPLGRSTAPLSAARTPMPMPPPSASSFVTAGSSDGSRSIPLGHEVKVLLRRRTLLVMTGDARYRYAHGIQREDVLSDRRVSFTLRETV